MATYKFAGIEVKYNYSKEVLAALKNAKVRGLKACGERAVKYARDLVPVDTSALKNSINSAVEGNDVYIGTNTPYAPYIEFGTGQYAEGGGGRKTPWVYTDGKGNTHMTNGYKPHPYLRPAASEHTEEYLSILRNSFENT